ncbi:DUF892 family protein [Pedobacter chitinilyticus]|uniref:Ferritin-like domain-containing protein n=1 Tax=Pedobacter chitinilyticus TaxID=2233776 RepID=A0A3S3R872_9SPHI|nr:DUF892 family protein [Pedobacter chitinilyticus]RWU10177.1 ferritin-like domain-containing protein [Pedobacter chitinilyticus]
MVNVIHSNVSKEKTLNKEDLRSKSLVESIQLVYDAERQWLTVLPILQLAVGNEDLLELLIKFQKVGKDHLHRLESCFEALGVEILSADNKDMEVLIEECYDIIDVTPRFSFIRDAGLIVGMQQAQQYQVTAYTSLLAQALELDEQKVINLIKIIIHHKQQEEEQLAMADTGTMLDEIT